MMEHLCQNLKKLHLLIKFKYFSIKMQVNKFIYFLVTEEGVKILNEDGI